MPDFFLDDEDPEVVINGAQQAFDKGTGGGGLIGDVFGKIQGLMKSQPDLVKSTDAVFQFELTGKSGKLCSMMPN